MQASFKFLNAESIVLQVNAMYIDTKSYFEIALAYKVSYY